MKTIVEPLRRRSSAHSTIDSTGQAFIHSEAFVHSEANRPSTPMLDPSSRLRNPGYDCVWLGLG